MLKAFYSKKVYKKSVKRRKKNNTKKIKKINCSPISLISSNSKKKYTCYSDDSLIKMKNIWNVKYPDNKINDTQPKMIWESFQRKLSNICDKESCWLKQEFIKNNVDSELLESFAPKQPESWRRNPNEWLSSDDIINVMKQYEKAYKCFKFLGPTPIDFDEKLDYEKCVWDDLCKFNLKEELNKGKNKFGVIFNTDPHNKNGEHWISLFINTKKKLIFFFDSAGDKIPDQIMKFVNRVIEQGKNLEIPLHFHFDQNYPFVHQYGNTECGMYSLYFIIYMLKDKLTEKYLKTHILTDKYIEHFRKIFYNATL
jgi:hypothetical protein